MYLRSDLGNNIVKMEEETLSNCHVECRHSDKKSF